MAHRINVAYNTKSPYVAGMGEMKKASPDYNFAVVYPQYVHLWHPTANGALQPTNIMPKSAKLIVQWLCTEGHEYPRSPCNQVKYEGKCPICNGRRVVHSNSFAAKHPDLAALWHPTKNGAVTLSGLAPGSERNSWWMCSNGHEYQRMPVNQVKAQGRCPVCNIFSVEHPGLASLWHPTKNDLKMPTDVTSGSTTQVWWLCKSGHEYLRHPYDQVKFEGRCPICTGKKVIFENSFAAHSPAIAAQWHPTKNGKLSPEKIRPKSNEMAWWICERGHEYPMLVNHRTDGGGCPYCYGRKASLDDNLAVRFPDVAKDWHPTKNGNLTARDVRHGSEYRAWWLCPNGHDYQAMVYSRSQGQRCTYCFGRNVCFERSLSGEYPEIAATWHPTKNGDLRPDEVFPTSLDKVWWLCAKGHEFRRTPAARIKFKECQYCSGRKLAPDNSLAVLYPDLAQEWHPTKNNGKTAAHVRAKSSEEGWWLCPSGHAYKNIIRNRTVLGIGCGVCSGHQVDETNNLAAARPRVAAEWDYEKNGDLRPEQIYYGSTTKVWWKCARGHSWPTTPGWRERGTNCPHCRPKTSRMEIFVYCEMMHVFENVEWRSKIEGKEADILIPDHKIVIEVDGSFWHRDKTEKDERKTKAFHKLGFTVFRVREGDLPLMSDRDVSCPVGKCDPISVTALLGKIQENTKLPRRIQARISRYQEQSIQQNAALFEEIVSAVRDRTRPDITTPKVHQLDNSIQYRLNL